MDLDTRKSKRIGGGLIMTLQQLSDKLGVHPYDLVGDAELADELMHEDIRDTIFYKELKQYEPELGLV